MQLPGFFSEIRVLTNFIEALSIQPKILKFSVGTSNGTDRFDLV